MPLHSPSEMYKCQDLATFLPSHQEELICRRSDILTNLVQNSTRKKIKSNRKIKTQSGFVDCDNCGAWNSAYKTEDKSSLNLCDDCIEGTHVL